MKAYVIVKVIEGYPYGQRFNGQYSYYCASHATGAEVFFNRRDAEAIVKNEPDSRSHILCLNIPDVVQPSLGAAVVRWSDKIVKRDGYFPTVASAKAKLKNLIEQQDLNVVRSVRKLSISDNESA